MAFRLGAMDQDTILLPINIGPFQQQVLTWAAKPPKATQGEDQLPLSIGAGFNHLLRHLAADEMLAGLVGHASRLHLGEWILRDHLPPHALLEKLPRRLPSLADRGFVKASVSHGLPS